MITATAWLARFRALMKPRNEDSSLDSTEALLERLPRAWPALAEQPALEHLYETTAPFKHPGLAYFTELPESKAMVENDHLLDSFVYAGAHAATSFDAVRVLRRRGALLDGIEGRLGLFPRTDGGDLPTARVLFAALMSRS